MGGGGANKVHYGKYASDISISSTDCSDILTVLNLALFFGKQHRRDRVQSLNLFDF